VSHPRQVRLLRFEHLGRRSSRSFRGGHRYASPADKPQAADTGIRSPLRGARRFYLLYRSSSCHRATSHAGSTHLSERSVDRSHAFPARLVDHAGDGDDHEESPARRVRRTLAAISVWRCRMRFLAEDKRLLGIASSLTVGCGSRRTSRSTVEAPPRRDSRRACAGPDPPPGSVRYLPPSAAAGRFHCHHCTNTCLRPASRWHRRRLCGKPPRVGPLGCGHARGALRGAEGVAWTNASHRRASAREEDEVWSRRPKTHPVAAREASGSPDPRHVHGKPVAWARAMETLRDALLAAQVADHRELASVVT
jgi:hypothetical protein